MHSPSSLPRRLALAVAVPFVLTLPCAAMAQPVAPPDAPTPAAAPVKPAEEAFAWKLSGAWSVWGLDQRNFFLGNTNQALNDADYIVQNVRLQVTAGTKAVGGVLRADLAQGWWGVDNAPDVETTLDASGKPTGTTYNPYGLYRDKDTMYPVHVDHAYLFAELPWAPVRVEVGRQLFGVGNLLVLDQDLDGLRARVRLGDVAQVQGFWAKLSEGNGSYRSPSGSLMADFGKWKDADLFGIVVDAQLGKQHRAEAFALHFNDSSGPTRYFPQGIGYFHARFQPQVSEAQAFGLRLKGTLPVLAGLSYDCEADVLMGKDDIQNADFAGNLLDKNDGDLFGYNAYLQLVQKIDVGMPLEIGLTAGMGSGDEDPASGKGNLNRIQTMGFFPLANVWEDSIMPDIAGITPQGLGSPASRGYRELENTTVAQLRVGVQPVPLVRVDASYSYLRATQPVHGWNASGPKADVTASDLGQEVDVGVTFFPLKGLTYKVLWGWFQTGDAAALLINGNTTYTEPAYEVKQELTWKF